MSASGAPQAQAPTQQAMQQAPRAVASSVQVIKDYASQWSAMEARELTFF
jgi:hypothetical protein